MSGKHRKERGESRAIYRALVHDLDFIPLHPNAKLLWYTLRLELGASGIGVYYAAQLPEPTGLTMHEVDAALQELSVTQWLVRERNVMWLRNAWRFDPYLSRSRTTHVQAVCDHLRGLPQLAIVDRFCEYYGIERAWLSAPVPDPMPALPDDHWARVGATLEPTYALQEVGSSSKEVGVTDPTAVRVAKRPREYSEDFEKAWGLYPKRAGDNPKKRAWRSWQARIREGVTPTDLLAGLERYAAHCKASGKLGTEFVLQAATFFGPDERWKAEYSATPIPTNSKDQARAAAETEALRSFSQRHQGLKPLIEERRAARPVQPESEVQVDVDAMVRGIVGHVGIPRA